jgi:lipopolysaccharide transport system permease protein
MKTFSANPLELVRSVLQHRRLIWDLAVRDAMGRYKSSYLGVFWALITPLLLLSVYAFVFSQIFQSKWDVGTGGAKAEFVVVLFAGLIVFNVFAECVVRAPSAILAVPSYVKKIVFPLEILTIVNLCSSLIHFSIGLCLLFVAQLVTTGTVPIIGWLLPIALLPLVAFTLAVTWFLSALGVYVRDINQIVSVAVTALLFLSPVFYPLTAVPEKWRWMLYFNPLTLPVEATRDLLVFNRWPDFTGLAAYTLACIFVMLLGFAWFQKTRRGFADVL